MRIHRHLLTPAVERAQARRRARAEQAADAAEARVRRVWDELMAVIAAAEPWMTARNRAAQALRPLERLAREIGEDLVAAARDAHGEATAAIASRLPRAQLVRVAEAEGLPPALPLPRMELGEIFPAPRIEDLVRIVFATGWEERIAAQTRLAQPGAIAALIANGLQQGQTPAKIARTIRPFVQGVQSTAKRIARTEAMRVAGELQLEAFEGLGDLVVGYTVHSVVGNPYSRPWHVQRSGTQYFKNPAPGQKGLRQMPRPPMEAEDPAERPAGTPQLAHNCLCYLTPLLREI